MIAVVTPAEMKAVDESAPEPVEVLVERAGAAVARAALEVLGGGYGRRVTVVAGKGNNGADGRAAARRLRRRGVAVEVVDAASTPRMLPPAHLVIDAAYGTGFHGDYQAPDPAGAPVLAVDIPSGVDGLTGEAGPGAVRATRTVTFAALKPGLLLGRGPDLAGDVTVAGIGLDTSGARAWLVEGGDVRGWIPEPPRDRHKWNTALWVVAGSPGMTGAADLCSRAAMRAGAGTVRLGVPGGETAPRFPEVVGRPIPGSGWAEAVAADAGRAKALVIGPGLGRDDGTRREVRRLLEICPLPAVVDADGLWALGPAAEAGAVLRARPAPTVLTPHDGEFAGLAGAAPGPDRIEAVRRLAVDLGATVLLKGPTTAVAGPGGRILLTGTGDPRLATAGTGDVLSGVVGALLAQGVGPHEAAAGGAYAHGAAARRGWSRGLVAGDLLDALPPALAGLGEPDGQGVRSWGPAGW